jgi:hypothetical protein
MWIMNAVWPVVALFGSAAILWLYFRYGRLSTHEAMQSEGKPKKPKLISTAEATLHCGAGCTLGDICAEWLAFAAPAVAVWFGWHELFGEKLFAVWILDYLFAFAFGIAFQYFTIAPMKQLPLGKGLIEALKADTLSLTAWQVGMYGFMAIAQFVIFRRGFGARLEVASPEFWFMMQIAMLAGFATSWPVNAWLLRIGVKEAM